MKKHILVRYKAGISKITLRDEEYMEYESNLSLDALLSKIFNLYNISESHHLVNKHDVLLMLNGKFVPLFETKRILLKEGDVITLLPTISGG